MTLRDSAALLALQQGEVVYANGTRALTPTSLAFNAGEFVVLLGPSGAGKSTLLRVLNGLVPLSSGTLHSAGQGEIRHAAALRHHRRSAAMVFQHHQLIGRLTALDNVLTGRLGHHGAMRALFPLPRNDRFIALRALDKVGLLDCALTRVDELSGGQQQRVGIARALAQQPRIMLADEPVASLDPGTATRVLGLIDDVCRADGIAVVVSLHQVELARRYADRIVGVNGGYVVFDGAPHVLDAATIDRIYGHDTAVPMERTAALAA